MIINISIIIVIVIIAINIIIIDNIMFIIIYLSILLQLLSSLSSFQYIIYLILILLYSFLSFPLFVISGSPIDCHISRTCIFFFYRTYILMLPFSSSFSSFNHITILHFLLPLTQKYLNFILYSLKRERKKNWRIQYKRQIKIRAYE